MKLDKRTHFGFSFQKEAQNIEQQLTDFEHKNKQWFGTNGLQTSLKFAQSQQTS